MKDETKAKLEEIIMSRLDNAEESDAALTSALNAIHSMNEIEKIENDKYRIDIESENNDSRNSIDLHRVEIEENKLEHDKHKFETSKSLDERRLKLDETIASKEGKFSKDDILKLVELGLVLVTLPLDFMFKSKFAQNICEFEKTGYFSSMAGKSLSGLFRWKK